MILAAGLGTRLRPLTNDRPKALVELNGHTLLEMTLARLREFGIRDVIINVHHFADKVIDYLKANENFGMSVAISREDVLLDTGGGLKKAAWFFQQGAAEEPFLLHNADVISTIDLARMLRYHAENHALATLAVQDRKTSRHLLFDDHLQLCGRRFEREQRTEWARETEPVQPFGFSGIHVISPRLLPMIEGDGAFSIIPSYLQMAAQGERILAFRADEYYWRDLGTPESLIKAAEEINQTRICAGLRG
jgi:NDP-sugar pyrophosphorylase family protein